MIKKTISWFELWYRRYWVNRQNCSGFTGTHDYCSKCPAYKVTNTHCEE